MRTAIGLINALGIQNYTQRHIDDINEFIGSNETDVKKLLDKLGSWDSNDLAAAEKWMTGATNDPHGSHHVTINAEDEETEIVCVIDRSTSMGKIIDSTIEGFNAFVIEQKKLPGKAKLTLCLFDGDMYGHKTDTYTIVHDGIDIKDVPTLDKSVYQPQGWTAMLDAIGATIHTLASRIGKMQDKPKVVFLIMTDGEENASKEYTGTVVFDLIKEKENTEGWSFVFLGANIDTIKEGGKMGVSLGNTRSFNASDAGMHDAYASMTKGVSKMRMTSKFDASYMALKDNLMADDIDQTVDDIMKKDNDKENKDNNNTKK